MITVSTLREHVEHGYKLIGHCRQDGNREIDLGALIAAGYGDVHLSDIVRRCSGERIRGVPRLTCRQCGGALSMLRAPPTTGASYKAPA